MADSDLETPGHILIEAQLANCLNIPDSRDRGIELMNIVISQSLSRAHAVLLADIIQSSLSEFSNSDRSLCSFVYSAIIPIFYLSVKSTKIGLFLVSGLKLRPPNLRIALILSALGGRVLDPNVNWISLNEETEEVHGLYEVCSVPLMELSQVNFSIIEISDYCCFSLLT